MVQHRKLNPTHFRKGHILLLCSTAAALCLFLTIIKLTVLVLAAIFLLTAAYPWLVPGVPRKHPFRADVLVLAATFAVTGFATFYSTWRPSSLIGTIAARLHLTPGLLVGSLGCIGCIVGFYAFYRLAFWFQKLLCDYFHADASGAILPGLRKNWVFLLSAAAFFCLESNWNPDYLCCALAATAVAWVVAVRCAPVKQLLAPEPVILKTLSTLSSLGICLFRQAAFHQGLSLPGYIGWVLAILAFPFVYLCVSGLYRVLYQQVLLSLWGSISRREWILFGVLAAVLLSMVAFCFFQTDIFYGTESSYDVLYTSDSPILVKNNAYLALTYKENDLRQPLFAVFSAPFVGMFYLVTRLLPMSAACNALLLNIPQVLLMLLSYLMIAATLSPKAGPRICFLLLAVCTYPFVLFSVMMEQYIFAFFWLVVALYLFTSKKGSPLAVWGAGSTLLTSLVLLPTLSRQHPVKAFSGWLQDMLRFAMGFVVLAIAFGRLEIILGAPAALIDLSRFSDVELTLWDKLCQYTCFIRGTLFAVPSVQVQNMLGFPSWQQAAAVNLDLWGILILILCGVSLVLNRRLLTTKLAGAWVLFSFVMLVGLGWGTQENGLILYGLYFGWAFLVLLFQLGQRLCKKLKQETLLPILTAIGMAPMIWVNFSAMAQILSFALTHYPL